MSRATRERRDVRHAEPPGASSAGADSPVGTAITLDSTRL